MDLTHDQAIAYNKAAFFCSKSEHCSSEIREKLKLWGVSSDDSGPVIEKLTAEKYIDDARFACAYAKDKFRFNHWGKQKIAFMLRSKSISSEVVELALEEIEDEGYADELRKLLTDKERSIKANDKFDKRNKLMRFGLSRGFESNQIYAVLKELGI